MRLSALASVMLILGIITGFALRDTIFQVEAAKSIPQGRVIDLGIVQVNAPQGTVVFPLQDIRDCLQPTVLIQSTNEDIVDFIGIKMSMDGTDLVGTNIQRLGITSNGLTAALGSWPFVQVEAGELTEGATAQIWCAP